MERHEAGFSEDSCKFQRRLGEGAKGDGRCLAGSIETFPDSSCSTCSTIRSRGEGALVCSRFVVYLRSQVCIPFQTEKLSERRDVTFQTPRPQRSPCRLVGCKVELLVSRFDLSCSLCVVTRENGRSSAFYFALCYRTHCL